MIRAPHPPEGWTRDAEAWADLDRLKERMAGELPPDDSPLVCRCASQIAPEPVEWLWPGRLAFGKHTCIAGEPGTGKSQLATYIAAQISMGAAWPCGEGTAPQGSVLVLSAEDGEADTIVPRLYAAEADCGRIHIVSAVRTDLGQRRAFNLQADIELLEQKIRELGDVALVVIDPISSYLGKTDSHKNADVRSVLEPLSAMAERARVAVLTVTHFAKSGASNTTKALHRFIGSIAFIGAPRTAFAVIEDADDKERRLFLHAKNNLAPPPQGLAFRLRQTIVGEPGKGIVASRVDWERDPVTITADEALAAEHASPSEEAEAFLRELLADGPVPAKQVQADADSAGFSWRTVRRAKERLGVKHTKERGDDRGGWLWSLPPKVATHDDDAHVDKLAKLATFQQNSQKFEGAVATFQQNSQKFEGAHRNPKKTAENLEGGQGGQLSDVDTFSDGEHLRSQPSVGAEDDDAPEPGSHEHDPWGTGADDPWADLDIPDYLRATKRGAA